MTIAVSPGATTPSASQVPTATRVSPAQEGCQATHSDLTTRPYGIRDEVPGTTSPSLAAVEAVRQVGRATAAHSHVGRITGVAAVLDMDPLDRHLASTRLLEDHLRTVVQIVAAAARTARPRVSCPLDQARCTRELDVARLERRTAEVVVGPARRAHDLETHAPSVRVSIPARAPTVAVSTPMLRRTGQPRA